MEREEEEGEVEKKEEGEELKIMKWRKK